MEQFINTVNNPWFFAALIGTFGLYLVTLSLVLAIWTARDIRARSHSQTSRILLPFFVFVFGFAGFVPYLVLRPRQTFVEREQEQRDRLLLAEAAKKFECPQCFAVVERDFAFCPSCKLEFRPVCSCSAVLDPSWKRCPYCGTTILPELKLKKYVLPIITKELRGAYISEVSQEVGQEVSQEIGQLKKIEANAQAKSKKIVEQPKLVPARQVLPAFLIKVAKSMRAKAKPELASKPAIKPIQKQVPVKQNIASVKQNISKSKVTLSKPMLEREIKLTGFSALFKRTFAIKR
ncbi:MAG: zinc ribbon domain-containing protein [Parcubacteria group bacterium]